MQQHTQDITQEEQQHYKRHVERRRAHLARHITEETLGYLEQEFQTELPCYQTRDPISGQPIPPDPILAAIRDGQREVLLWLRREIALGRQTAAQNDEQD